MVSSMLTCSINVAFVLPASFLTAYIRVETGHSCNFFLESHRIPVLKLKRINKCSTSITYIQYLNMKVVVRVLMNKFDSHINTNVNVSIHMILLRIYMHLENCRYKQLGWYLCTTLCLCCTRKVIFCLLFSLIKYNERK